MEAGVTKLRATPPSTRSPFQSRRHVDPSARPSESACSRLEEEWIRFTHSSPSPGDSQPPVSFSSPLSWSGATFPLRLRDSTETQIRYSSSDSPFRFTSSGTISWQAFPCQRLTEGEVGCCPREHAKESADALERARSFRQAGIGVTYPWTLPTSTRVEHSQGRNALESPAVLCASTGVPRTLDGSANSLSRPSEDNLLKRKGCMSRCSKPSGSRASLSSSTREKLQLDCRAFPPLLASSTSRFLSHRNGASQPSTSLLSGQTSPLATMGDLGGIRFHGTSPHRAAHHNACRGHATHPVKPWLSGNTHTKGAEQIERGREQGYTRPDVNTYRTMKKACSPALSPSLQSDATSSERRFQELRIHQLLKTHVVPRRCDTETPLEPRQHSAGHGGTGPPLIPEVYLRNQLGKPIPCLSSSDAAVTHASPFLDKSAFAPRWCLSSHASSSTPPSTYLPMCRPLDSRISYHGFRKGPEVLPLSRNALKGVKLPESLMCRLRQAPYGSSAALHSNTHHSLENTRSAHSDYPSGERTFGRCPGLPDGLDGWQRKDRDRLLASRQKTDGEEEHHSVPSARLSLSMDSEPFSWRSVASLEETRGSSRTVSSDCSDARSSVSEEDRVRQRHSYSSGISGDSLVSDREKVSVKRSGEPPESSDRQNAFSILLGESASSQLHSGKDSGEHGKETSSGSAPDFVRGRADEREDQTSTPCAILSPASTSPMDMKSSLTEAKENRQYMDSGRRRSNLHCLGGATDNTPRQRQAGPSRGRSSVRCTEKGPVKFSHSHHDEVACERFELGDCPAQPHVQDDFLQSLCPTAMDGRRSPVTPCERNTPLLGKSGREGRDYGEKPQCLRSQEYTESVSLSSSAPELCSRSRSPPHSSPTKRSTAASTGIRNSQRRRSTASVDFGTEDNSTNKPDERLSPRVLLDRSGTFGCQSGNKEKRCQEAKAARRPSVIDGTTGCTSSVPRKIEEERARKTSGEKQAVAFPDCDSFCEEHANLQKSEGPFSSLSIESARVRVLGSPPRETEEGRGSCDRDTVEFLVNERTAVSRVEDPAGSQRPSRDTSWNNHANIVDDSVPPNSVLVRPPFQAGTEEVKSASGADSRSGEKQLGTPAVGQKEAGEWLNHPSGSQPETEDGFSSIPHKTKRNGSEGFSGLYGGQSADDRGDTSDEGDRLSCMTRELWVENRRAQHTEGASASSILPAGSPLWTRLGVLGGDSIPSLPKQFLLPSSAYAIISPSSHEELQGASDPSGTRRLRTPGRDPAASESPETTTPSAFHPLRSQNGEREFAAWDPGTAVRMCEDDENHIQGNLREEGEEKSPITFGDSSVPRVAVDQKSQVQENREGRREIENLTTTDGSADIQNRGTSPSGLGRGVSPGRTTKAQACPTKSKEDTEAKLSCRVSFTGLLRNKSLLDDEGGIFLHDSSRRPLPDEHSAGCMEPRVGKWHPLVSLSCRIRDRRTVLKSKYERSSDTQLRHVKKEKKTRIERCMQRRFGGGTGQVKRGDRVAIRAKQDSCSWITLSSGTAMGSVSCRRDPASERKKKPAETFTQDPCDDRRGRHPLVSPPEEQRPGYSRRAPSVEKLGDCILSISDPGSFSDNSGETASKTYSVIQGSGKAISSSPGLPPLQKGERECSGNGSCGEPRVDVYPHSNDGDTSSEGRRHRSTGLLPSAPGLSRYPFSTNEDETQGTLQSNAGDNLIPLAGEASCVAFLADSSPLSITSLSASRGPSSSSPEGVHRLASGSLSFSSRSSCLSNSDALAEPDLRMGWSIGDVPKSKVCGPINKKLSPSLLRLLVRCASRKSTARREAQETTRTGTEGELTGTINGCSKRISGAGASAGEEREDRVLFASTQKSNEVKGEQYLSPSSSHLVFVAANQREASSSVEHTQFSSACTTAASFVSQERPRVRGQEWERLGANISTDFGGRGETSTREETNGENRDLIHPGKSFDGTRVDQRTAQKGRKTASHPSRRRSNSARGVEKRQPPKSGFEAAEGRMNRRREAPPRQTLGDSTPLKDSIEEGPLEEEGSHLDSSGLLHLVPTPPRAASQSGDTVMSSTVLLGVPASPQQFPCSRAVSQSHCHRLQPQTPPSPSALSRPASCRSSAQSEAVTMDRYCSSLNSSRSCFLSDYPNRNGPPSLPLDPSPVCAAAPSPGLSRLECFTPRAHSPCRSVSAPLSLDSSSPSRGCSCHSRRPGQSKEKVEEEESYKSHSGQSCHTTTSVFRQLRISARSGSGSSYDRLHLHTPVASPLVTTSPRSPACALSSFPCLDPPTDRLSTSGSRLSLSAPDPEHSAIHEQLPEPDIPPPGPLMDACPSCPMPSESFFSPLPSLAPITTPEAFTLHQAGTLRKAPTRFPKGNPDRVPKDSEAPEAVCAGPSLPETLTANNHRAFCRNNTPAAVTSSPSCSRDRQAKATSDNLSSGACESRSVLSSPKLGQWRRVTTPDVLRQLPPSVSAYGNSCERQQPAFDDPHPFPTSDSLPDEEKLGKFSQHEGLVASDSVPLLRRCESGCASATVLQSPISSVSDQAPPSFEGEPAATEGLHDSASHRPDAFGTLSVLSSEGVEKGVQSHPQGHTGQPGFAILSQNELAEVNQQSVSRQDSSVFSPLSSSRPSRLPLVKQGTGDFSVLKNDDSRTRTTAPFPSMSLSPLPSGSARESPALSTAEEEGTARGRPSEYIPTTTASSSAGVRNVSTSKHPLSSPEHLQAFLPEEHGYMDGASDSPPHPQLCSHDGRMECTPILPLRRRQSSVSSSSGFSEDTSSSFLSPRLPSSDLLPPSCTLTPFLPLASITQDHQSDRLFSCPVSPQQASPYCFPSGSLVAALPSDLLLRSHVSSHMRSSYERTCQPPLLSAASAFSSGTSSHASVDSPSSFSPSCPPSSPATSVVPGNREATSAPTSGPEKNGNGQERGKAAPNVVEGKNAPASLTGRQPTRVPVDRALEGAAADVSADLPENQTAPEDADGAYEAIEGFRDNSVEAFFAYVVDTIRGSDVCPTISLAKRFALEAASGGILASRRGEPEEEEKPEQTTARRGDENTTGENGLASPGSQPPLLGEAGSPDTSDEVKCTVRKARGEESLSSSRSGKENDLMLNVPPPRRDFCPLVPVDDGRRAKDISKEEQELGRRGHESSQTAAFCGEADPGETREEDVLFVEGHAMCKRGRSQTASRSPEPGEDLYILPNEEELRGSWTDVRAARMSTLRLWRTKNLSLRARVHGSSLLQKKRATKTRNHQEKRKDASVCDAEGRGTVEAEEDLLVRDHSGDGVFLRADEDSWLAPEEAKREKASFVEIVDYGKLTGSTGTVDGTERGQGEGGGKMMELAEGTSLLEQTFPGTKKQSKEPRSHEGRDDGDSCSSLFQDEQAKKPAGRTLQAPDFKTEREDCERMVEAEVEALEREREMLDVFLRSRAPTAELGERESGDQGAINAKSNGEEEGDAIEKGDLKHGGEVETENSDSQREEDHSAYKRSLQRRSSCETDAMAHLHSPSPDLVEDDLKDTECPRGKKSDGNVGCGRTRCDDMPRTEEMQTGKSSPCGSFSDLPQSIGSESELLDVIRMLLLRHSMAVSDGRLPTFLGGKEAEEKKDTAARSVLAASGEETTPSKRRWAAVEPTEERSSLQQSELERTKLAENQTTPSSCLAQSPKLSPRTVLSGIASGVVTGSRDNGEYTSKDSIVVRTAVTGITERPLRKDRVGEGEDMQAAASDQGDACHGGEGKSLLHQEDSRQKHSPGEENISGVDCVEEKEAKHFKGDEQEGERTQGLETRRIVSWELQSEADGSGKTLEKSRGEPVSPSEKSLSEHRSFSEDEASEHKERKISLEKSDGSLRSPIPVPSGGEQDKTTPPPPEDRQARKTRPFLITQDTSAMESNRQQEVLGRTNVDEEELLLSPTDPDKDVAAGTPRTESTGEKAREVASPENKPENHNARGSSPLGGNDGESLQQGTKRSEACEALTQSRLAEEKVIQDERNGNTSTGQDTGDRVSHRDDVAEKNVRMSASENGAPSQAPEEKMRGRGRSYKKTGLRPVSVKLPKKRLNSGVVIGGWAKEEERGNGVQETRQTELSDAKEGSRENEKASPEKGERSCSLPDSDTNRLVTQAGNEREVNKAALTRGESESTARQTEHTQSEMQETKAVVAVEKRAIRPLHRQDSTKFRNTCRSSSLLAEPGQEKKGDESEKRKKERRSSLTSTDGQASPKTAEDDRGKESTSPAL